MLWPKPEAGNWALMAYEVPSPSGLESNPDRAALLLLVVVGGGGRGSQRTLLPLSPTPRANCSRRPPMAPDGLGITGFRPTVLL